MTPFQLRSTSAEATRAYGKALGALLAQGHLVALKGELGAGKTTFAQGIGVGWGVTGPMTSPTFTLVRQYSRAADDLLLHHLDLYRLAGADDLASIGWDDILDTLGAILIEWPERAADALPSDHLSVQLSADDNDEDSRLLDFSAGGLRSALLLEGLALRLAASDQTDELEG